MPELYVRVPQPGRDRAALRWACLGYCYFGVVTDIYHLAVVALLSAAVQSRTSSIRYSRTANALLPEMVAPIRVKRISFASKAKVHFGIPRGSNASILAALALVGSNHPPLGLLALPSKWPTRLGSNQHAQLQRLLCYRYTTSRKWSG